MTVKLLPDNQYKYLEKSLYNYTSKETPVDPLMRMAISETLEYFEGTKHETMMREFYFNHDSYRQRYTPGYHYSHVCWDLLCTELSNGYVIKREIVYRLAMVCFELGILKTDKTNNIRAKENLNGTETD